MGKIYCIIGKSATGKDTIYKAIKEEYYSDIEPIVTYTTRPKRKGEKEGEEYHFVSYEQFLDYDEQDLILEQRKYDTVYGEWVYFTLKFDFKEDKDYIILTTIEGALAIQNYYGEENVSVVCISAFGKTRLLRSINREKKVDGKCFNEICRRFLADEEDYSLDKLLLFKHLFYITNESTINDALQAWQDIYKKFSQKEYNVFTKRYKNFVGTIEDDYEGLLYGRLLNTSDNILYHGRSLVQLEQAFHKAVDNYMETLKNINS